MNYLIHQKILITGGAGFLGRHVCQAFTRRGISNQELSRNPTENSLPGVYIPRSRDFDLITQDGVGDLFRAITPDIIIHLAATVGGIGANQSSPTSFYFNNIMMNTLLVDRSISHLVHKFVAIGSVCAYPKNARIPFEENDLWNGYPEETNAPYGVAKRAMLTHLMASESLPNPKKMRSVYLLPVNLYGPNDNFNLHTSHVIPALIRKIDHALKENEDEIVCWGNGLATREFLYVEDAAEAIVIAAEKCDRPNPINLGSGREISILDLVSLIAELMRYKGRITWDTTKPNGQPRRCLDTSKAKQILGWEATTELGTGLLKTIEWYRSNK
jgi:GDP-L-fucose synthase